MMFCSFVFTRDVRSEWCVQGGELQVHHDRMDETAHVRRRCYRCVQSLREWHRRGISRLWPVLLLIH